MWIRSKTKERAQGYDLKFPGVFEKSTTDPEKENPE